jgi:uncharacterized membrane protein
LFYVLFIFGLTYFVTYPHFSDGIGKVAVTGLLFGLITYATYDLTNHATVRDWPFVVTIVDICWGAILGVLVSTLAYSVVHLIQRGVV